MNHPPLLSPIISGNPSPHEKNVEQRIHHYQT